MRPIHLAFAVLVMSVSLSFAVASWFLPLLGFSQNPLVLLGATLLLVPVVRVVLGVFGVLLAMCFVRIFGSGVFIVIMMMLFPNLQEQKK